MDEDTRREPRLIPAEREALAGVDDRQGDTDAGNYIAQLANAKERSQLSKARVQLNPRIAFATYGRIRTPTSSATQMPMAVNSTIGVMLLNKWRNMCCSIEECTVTCESLCHAAWVRPENKSSRPLRGAVHRSPGSLL
jgi:hypothetical protein